MLYSLALVFLLGMLLGKASQKLGLPPLFGMLLAGILLGSSVFDLLSPSLSAVSADLRKVALLIILARAGLNLDVGELRQVGRPAFLMCFLPATCEIVGMILLAPPLLGLSLLESALLGAVIAAVSPAVVVPKMLSLLEKGWGKNHHIPQLVMAGASAERCVCDRALFGIFRSVRHRPFFSSGSSAYPHLHCFGMPCRAFAGANSGPLLSKMESASCPPSAFGSVLCLFALLCRRPVHRLHWFFRPAGRDGHGGFLASCFSQNQPFSQRAAVPFCGAVRKFCSSCW